MQRRKLDFHDFDAPVIEVDWLQRGGYQRAGSWDLAQICEHLAIVMEGSLDGFAFPPAPWFWRRVLGPVLVRMTVWTRWIPQGLPAPDPSFLPRGEASVSEARQRFERALERVRNHTGEFVPHPVLGRLKSEHWRQVHLIHAAYHLSFLVPEEAHPEVNAQLAPSASEGKP